MLPIALLAATLWGQPEKLVLGTIHNLPPFSFYKGKLLTGIDIDTIQEIARRAGIEVEIIPMPWGRVLADLESGKIDGAFSLYEVEERKKFALYLGIIHHDNLGLVVCKQHNFTFTGIKDLTGKRVGKGIGVVVSPEFAKAAADGLFTLEEINDTNMGNIKKLRAGRIDVVIGVVETMLFFARRLGYDKEIVPVAGCLQNSRPGWLVISRQSPVSKQAELIERLKKATTEVMNGDFYQTARNAYADFLTPPP